MLVFTVCFVGLAILLIGSHARLDASQRKLEVLEKKSEMLQRHKKQLERKNLTLGEVRHFLDRAASLGLNKEIWTYYDVNIQEPVTFSAMEEILNQCNNSSAAFYKPISLHIKKITPEKVRSNDRTSSRSHDSRSRPNGDLLITLSGKFIARPK